MLTVNKTNRQVFKENCCINSNYINMLTCVAAQHAYRLNHEAIKSTDLSVSPGLLLIRTLIVIFSARCNIYISRLCHDASPSVCPSVCDVCALWSQGAIDLGYLCMLG